MRILNAILVIIRATLMIYFPLFLSSKSRTHINGVCFSWDEITIITLEGEISFSTYLVATDVKVGLNVLSGTKVTIKIWSLIVNACSYASIWLDYFRIIENFWFGSLLKQFCLWLLRLIIIINIIRPNPYW